MGQRLNMHAVVSLTGQGTLNISGSGAHVTRSRSCLSYSGLAFGPLDLEISGTLSSFSSYS